MKKKAIKRARDAARQNQYTTTSKRRKKAIELERNELSYDSLKNMSKDENEIE